MLWNILSCQCSLAVEHPLSKREVVGSNPAIACFTKCVTVPRFLPFFSNFRDSPRGVMDNALDF